MQECCICGKYASCTEVSISGDRNFRCCSRKCLKVKEEREQIRKKVERKHEKEIGDYLAEIQRQRRQIERMKNMEKKGWMQ